MGRKSSSEGLLIVLVIGAAILYQVIIYIWNHLDVFLPIIIIGGLFWLNRRKKESSSTSSTRQINQNTKSFSNTSLINKKVNPDSLWKGFGKSILINGLTINGGFIYVGSGLTAAKGYSRPEPALINPNLKIGNIPTANYSVRHLSYWSSYSEASPEARAAYLHWLSQGKSDPVADIGYVFLYFYGLERRALFDVLSSETAKQELPSIRNEIRRLLSIYKDNNSFNHYANSLLDYISDYQDNFDQPPELHARSWVLPFSYRTALGHFAVSGQPVSPDWAYGWLMMDPSVRLRTPAYRCTSEFKALFLEKYKGSYGEGIKLLVNKTRLKLIHRPASPSLLSGDYVKTTDLPDISVMAGPINKLQKVADECMDQLDAYSRVLGRSADKVGTLDAMLELPFAFWPASNREPLLQAKATIEKAGIPATIPFSKLRQWLPEWKEISKPKLISLTSRLAEISLGIEPDPRFGGVIPTNESKVVLFIVDQNLAAPSSQYFAAALTLQLAVAVSAADGGTNEAEKSHLIRQLEGWLHLSESERRRLRAHLRWLLVEEPGLNGLKKKIESIPLTARETLGDFLAGVAHADNEVSAAEVKVLERIFKLLELDSSSLYSKLHTAASEPVTVKIPDTGNSGFAVPKQPRLVEAGIKIDMAKVASLRAESEKVSAILGAIFNEASLPESIIEAESPSLDEEPAEESIMGLDGIHSTLVKILCSRSIWSKAELEALADDRSLMIDGVLEHINEAAFDLYDMPFSEGDDPIEVNQEVVKEILK